jgi:hypothetical protein
MMIDVLKEKKNKLIDPVPMCSRVTEIDRMEFSELSAQLRRAHRRIQELETENNGSNSNSFEFVRISFEFR